MGLNFATPLLTVLAVVNSLLILAGASRRLQLTVGCALIVLSSILLKDWVEGLVYLLKMP